GQVSDRSRREQTDEVRMGGECPQIRPGPGLEGLIPGDPASGRIRRSEGADVDLGDDAGTHELDDFAAPGHVVVERGDLPVDATGQGPHRQSLVSFLIDETERGVDESILVQQHELLALRSGLPSVPSAVYRVLSHRYEQCSPLAVRHQAHAMKQEYQ